MGVVFGKNGVEEPDFELLHKTPDGLEVRHYTQSSVMAYTACPGGVGSSDTSDAFRTLAKYIGVFSTPQNFAVAANSSQSISMTAPVLMTGSDQAQNDHAAPQSISMTAPVMMSNDATGSSRSSTTTMAFVLPNRQVCRKLALLLSTEYTPVLTLCCCVLSCQLYNGDRSTAHKPCCQTRKGVLLTALVVGQAACPVHSLPVPLTFGANVLAIQIEPYVAFVQKFNGRAKAQQFEDLAASTKDIIASHGLTPIEWRSAQYDPPFTIPYFRRNEVIYKVAETVGEVKAALAADGPNEEKGSN